MALLPFFLRIERRPLLLGTVRARLKRSASPAGEDLEHGEVIGDVLDVDDDRELVDGPVAIVVTNVPDVAMVLQI